jgi:hypothetical protein
VSRGGMLDVAARTATAVTLDTTATGMLTTGSALYAFADSAMVVGAVTATGDAPPTASPDVVFLPGGKWANARFRNFGGDADRVPALGEMYVVVFDTGTAGYGFALDVASRADLTGVQQLAEAEPNNAWAAAQTGAALTLFSGDLTESSDIDFIKVTATSGQTIRVITTAGGLSGTTDTEVAIFEADGTTELVRATDDGFGPEDVTSHPVPGGDYYVAVRQSQLGFCGVFFACDRYEAAILVE